MKYRDEKDKSFGLVGMAIAFRVWDAEDMYCSLNLDAQGFDCIDFSYDYYESFSNFGAPGAVLHHEIRMFKLMMGLTLSNVMCREIIGRSKNFGSADREDLKRLFEEIGREELELTKDECDTLFTKSVNYLQKLYGYGQVRRVAETFSKKFIDKREMTVNEIMGVLAEIGV